MRLKKVVRAKSIPCRWCLQKKYKYWFLIRLQSSHLCSSRTLSVAVFASSVPLSMLNWSTSTNICSTVREKHSNFDIHSFRDFTLSFFFKRNFWMFNELWQSVFTVFHLFIVCYYYGFIIGSMQSLRSDLRALLDEITWMINYSIQPGASEMTQVLS